MIQFGLVYDLYTPLVKNVKAQEIEKRKGKSVVGGYFKHLKS